MKFNKHTTEYFKKWEQIKLSDSTRTRMKRDLLEYARFNAVTEGVRGSHATRYTKYVSHGTTLITRVMSFKYTRMTAAALLVALVLGSGTAYAAQDTVPGDWLYPIKVQVNDNVRTALAFSDGSKAQVQAELVKERLQEAQQLAEEGRLNASTSAQLDANVQDHLAQAQKHSDAVASKGDVNTAANVRASLSGTFHSYEHVLSRLNDHVQGNNGRIFIDRLNAYADTIARAQEASSSHIDAQARVKIDVASALAHANMQLGQTKAELARNHRELSSETYATIDARLGDALNAQAQAQTAFDVGSYDQAYQDVQNAVSVANEVQNMIESAHHIKIHTRIATDDIFNSVTTKNDHDTTSASMHTEKNTFKEDASSTSTVDSDHSRMSIRASSTHAFRFSDDDQDDTSVQASSTGDTRIRDRVRTLLETNVRDGTHVHSTIGI